MRLRTSGDSAPWHRVRRDHEPVPLSIGMHEAPTVPKNCAILCGSATVMGLAGVAGLESRPSLSVVGQLSKQCPCVYGGVAGLESRPSLSALLLTEA